MGLLKLMIYAGIGVGAYVAYDTWVRPLMEENRRERAATMMTSDVSAAM